MTSTHTINGVVIETTHHYEDEWTATKAEWEPGMPVGYGDDEDDAIADLLNEIEERK